MPETKGQRNASGTTKNQHSLGRQMTRHPSSRLPAKQTGLALVAAGLTTALAVYARRRRAYSFAGKTVVITGGSRGLGLVLARQLASEGARLVLVARNSSELENAVDNIRAKQPSAEVTTVSADVTMREDAERAISTTINRYGRIDVLINNAGIIQVGPLDHMKLSDYDDAMKTHFWGPLYMVVEALPHFRNGGGGRIVNIASIGGRMAVPHLVPYSASKFALVGLSDGLRAELAGENILVTTVCPGLMRTGSPPNASFKGRHAAEYSWFAIASSLPGLTISAERAARQIIDACRRGQGELVITLPAKLAVVARNLTPGLFSAALSLVQEVLPKSGGADGDIARSGRLAGPGWAPAPLLAPMHAAAKKNNEL
jgi:NAD(P)-dependent dehydrogenase (short-subunit alcohol dehydrogenase family)